MAWLRLSTHCIPRTAGERTIGVPRAKWFRWCVGWLLPCLALGFSTSCSKDSATGVSNSALVTHPSSLIRLLRIGLEPGHMWGPAVLEFASPRDAFITYDGIRQDSGIPCMAFSFTIRESPSPGDVAIAKCAIPSYDLMHACLNDEPVVIARIVVGSTPGDYRRVEVVDERRVR